MKGIKQCILKLAKFAKNLLSLPQNGEELVATNVEKHCREEQERSFRAKRDQGSRYVKVVRGLQGNA